MSTDLTLVTDDELMGVMRTSIYPGAQDTSIKLALSYCKAQKLDPLMKPVHLVPMQVKVDKKPNGDPIFATIDQVMPGIGLYRTQASRTGAYAGQDEPVFGPTKTIKFKKKFTDWSYDQQAGRRVGKDRWEEVELSFPEYCKITVYRLVGGMRCAYTAVEFWLENYATMGGSDAPNPMWAKRSHGQLAKCSEAQALRKGFPEVGTLPTAEEMEGKVYLHEADEDGMTVGKPQLQKPRSTDEREPGQDDEERDEMNRIAAEAAGQDVGTEPAAAPAPTATSAVDRLRTGAPAAEAPSAPPAADNSGAAEDGQRKFLENKLAAKGLTVKDAVEALAIKDWAKLTKAQFNEVKNWINTQKEAA